MLAFIKSLPIAVQQYLIVTFSYWAFTLTDGALRMLVVLYFHQLGYSPLEVAMLFIFYEAFGIVTNLLGGWLGARLGLNVTLNLGLGLQLLALAMLLVDPAWLTVAYVMFAQALSGIAKDLNKMSAKSSIKLLLPDEQQGRLYSWIALLTGSKNALKGAGFFLGAALLALWGFQQALTALLLMLTVVFSLSVIYLKNDLGKVERKPKFKEVWSKSTLINRLSAARFFLFGSRDVWFVVALPIYLQAQLAWSPIAVGAALAGWIIVYGLIQALTPRITGFSQQHAPTASTVFFWTFGLIFLPLGLAILVFTELPQMWLLVIGLFIYALVFAVNSAMHSYLIVSYAKQSGVSLDVGFYYMANASGRLVGTLLSGWVFQTHGLAVCLLISSIMVGLATMMTKWLQAVEST
jgi:MFS family permease